MNQDQTLEFRGHVVPTIKHRWRQWLIQMPSVIQQQIRYDRRV